MHVDKLDLLNIRSYPTASINFSKGINLIIGPNNSGKSTILRSLQKLQMGLTGINSDDVRKTQEFWKIHIQLDGLTFDEMSLFQPKNGSLLLGKEQNILLTFWSNNGDGKREEFLQSASGKMNIFIENEDLKAELFTGAEAQDNDFVQFPQFPFMENENNFIYPFLAKRKTSHYTSQGGSQAAYGISEQLSNLPSRIQNLINNTHPYNEEYNKQAKDILGFAPGKVPGVQGNDDKLGIFVRQQDNVFLESMGDGVANVLGLLAILLTDDNKLFLIEELENDIHPEALKKLLAIIIEKSKYNQFVITTHSNIVLKYLASDPSTKIFYTDWQLLEGGGRNKYKIPTSQISEVGNTPSERLHILTKLGYDFFDFDMYASYILFEESSAEQLVREFLIPQFVPSLKSKVKTIAANGVDDLPARFYDFLRLFVYIHSNHLYKERAWVIADGDVAGVNALKLLKEKFNWPEEYFINLSKHNIEEYYPSHFKEEFQKINIEKDRKKRFEQKKLFTNQVMSWIEANPEQAKNSFGETAKELIDILLKIELIIQNK